MLFVKEKSEEQARISIKRELLRTMLVHMGLAAGLVSGAIHSTGDTVRQPYKLLKQNRESQNIPDTLLCYVEMSVISC